MEVPEQGDTLQPEQVPVRTFASISNARATWQAAGVPSSGSVEVELERKQEPRC